MVDDENITTLKNLCESKFQRVKFFGQKSNIIATNIIVEEKQ